MTHSAILPIFKKKKLNFYDLKLKKNNFDVVILAVHHNSLIKIFKKNSQINKKKIFHIDLQNLF